MLNFKRYRVRDDTLMKSGFSQSEQEILKANVAYYGGSLGEAIDYLVIRFRIALWTCILCTIFFVIGCFTESKTSIEAMGFSFLIAMLIMIFMQPPVLAYKCWRFRQKNPDYWG